MTPAPPYAQTKPGSIGIDGDDLVMEGQELAALADAIGAKPNALALLPKANLPAERQSALAAEFSQLEPALQKRVAIALGVLRSPSRIAYLHHTIADETVSRGLLAWSASVPDNIILAAGMGARRRVCFWTASTLKAHVTRILGAETKLPDDEIGYQVSSKAILLFLAILDQLRAVRLHAMLVHAEPDTTFSPAEIMDRLTGAGQEDFRWPLLFVDKVLPGLAASFTPQDAAEALRNLIAAKLVEQIAATANSQRFDLTEGGQVICSEILHDVSKVALSICEQRPDGQYGHDLVFLIRSPLYLFLFAMSGQEGAIAAINNDELEEVLSRAVAFPPAGTAPSEQPPAQPTAVPSPAAAVCPHCGGSVRFGLRFCEHCGKPAALEPAVAAPRATPRFCPGCGHPTAPDMRFCGNCGGTLG